MAGREVDCAHCGLPARAVAGQLAFCCAGCRTAYELLHACGLERYYALRDRLGEGGDAQPVAEPPGLLAYAHYDDPAFWADHGGRDGVVDLHVSGLHCAACVWVIDRLPRVLEGVSVARVNLGTGRVHLEWDPERVRLSRIASFLHRLGYPTHAVDAEAEDARRDGRRRELLRLAVAGACAGNVMLLAFGLYAGALGEFARFFQLASLLIALPAVTYGAWPFYRGALSGLRVRRLHMDLPISLGIVGGFAASGYAAVAGRGETYFDSVTVLVFLLLVGRLVQQRGQDWALSGAALLHRFLPATARRREGEDWALVPARTLTRGDRVQIQAGELFPADGRVRQGQTRVDLSSLTGEARPVRVGAGAEVFAGTRNLSDTVEVEVEVAGERTRVGALVARIEAAQHERAPIVTLADRIAGWFVAAVLALAAVGGLAWYAHDPARVFDVVVSLLVVSCPCALGLATPSALAIARARAARRGILVRSPAALEQLARVDTLVIDKTGTVTHGRMRVAWSTGIDSATRRAIAALESRARHPIADALRGWALEDAPFDLDDLDAVDVRELPGCGVEGVVAGRRVRIGSLAWLDAGADDAPTDRALAEGLTPVGVEIDGARVGLVAVGDLLREDAIEAVSQLRAAGFELEMCSGDHPRVVASVAARLGIDTARGGASPTDKADLVAGRANVAMIGDGINDAPALRAAGMGVAVGGGAEAAMEIADVYLARPGMSAVVELLTGARRTLALVRRNLAFSLVYNLTFASLALAGLISPLAAAILMPISSLTVLASSMVGRTFDASPRTRGLRETPPTPQLQIFPQPGAVTAASTRYNARA